MTHAEYCYGKHIHELPNTKSKVEAGERLLEILVHHRPLPTERIKVVAEKLNHNNRILKGGI